MEASGLAEETKSQTSDIEMYRSTQDRLIKVVFIGAGNVAWSLAPALDRLDNISICQVWSRNIRKSQQLSTKLKSSVPISDISDITADADLYLLSVTDDAVAELASNIRCNPAAIAVHTSGGVDASVLSPMTRHYGVFYPLQTFTYGVDVDLSEVPIFIEGSDDVTTDFLLRLASRISKRQEIADSSRRAIIHAAAVFACNFSNHFYAQANDILKKEGLGLDILFPLIDETVSKIKSISPAEAQTGPARRGDVSCMANHETLLNPEQKKLYHALSQSIVNYYNNSEKNT